MKLALILSALALTACATAPIAGSPVRNDGFAALGQPTRVGALVLTPLSVAEDSRCPINARCVWAGRLVVQTRVDGAGWRETVNLELGKQYTTHKIVIAFFSAQPAKMAGSTPSHSASLFGFEAL